MSTDVIKADGSYKEVKPIVAQEEKSNQKKS
jgi:hypothetical protein